VLLLHHPRKHAGPDGQWARGSGALTAHCDILLEMAYYTRSTEADRRRRLTAWSRFDATPHGRIIELTEAGTDYRNRGDFADDEFLTGWETVERLLNDATDKLTRRALLAAWPRGSEPPADNTLWRWLDRALAMNLIHRAGAGTRNDPYRYWNQSLEKKWQADPSLRQVAESMYDIRKSLGWPEE
jgi:hypothetical protein